MSRIPVNSELPELLTWARKSTGLDTRALAGCFPKLDEWESGTLQSTLRQREGFARAVYVPIGYLPDANVLALAKSLQCDLDFCATFKVAAGAGELINWMRFAQ